jgi:perosamine synthetase
VVEKTNIPFGKPMLSKLEIERVSQVLSGSTLVHGPVTREFEEGFAERIGAPYAVSVSSCTAGLHLSLIALGIGPGDEVIVPAMTHVATAHAVEYVGAIPIFVDVFDDSGNMNVAMLSSLITSRTKAIMPVHYLGLPCRMDVIRNLIHGTDIAVVEDCALAVDATFNGVKAGMLGDAGTFSFYPVKHMTTVEGGMVTTSNKKLAESVRKHRAFGYDRALGERSKPGIYDVDSLGFNYRMNEVDAAVGVTQLDKLDDFQKIRKENYSRLFNLLNDLDQLTIFNPVQGEAVSSHYCFNIVLPRDGSVNRDKVVEELSMAGIGSSVHYPCAVPLFSYYKGKYGYKNGQFPVAEWIASQTISLPVGPHLPSDGPEKIAAQLKKSFLQNQKR